jgi:hypothetical protein
MDQRNLVPGLILIGLGAFLFLAQVTGVGAEAIVAVIGIGFLLAYGFTREYGFLVPGGIMAGLGLGIVWETNVGSAGGSVVLGLGLGFLAIFVVDLLMKHTDAPWWPLIPGGILATIGLLIESGEEGVLADLTWLWPVLLIGAGVVLLLTQLTHRRGARPSPDEDRGA